MKNLIFALITLVIFTSCEAPQKIGYIDNGKVINEYQEKKDIEEKYKAKDEAFKIKTDSIGKAFQLEYQTLQLRIAKLSAQKQQTESQAINQKGQILQQQMQFEQQQLQKGFQNEIDSVITRVNDFVKEYGKTNGYSYILGQNEAGSVMYGKEDQDISQIIIDAINEKYNSK